MLPILKSLNKQFVFSGIVSMKGLTAGTLAKEFHIPNVFEDPRNLIESEHIDVVFLLSSHDNHAEYAKYALSLIHI